MKPPIKLTSEQWQHIFQDNFTVLDPDGWDRTPLNFQYQWYEELITFQEFQIRMTPSTCQWYVPIKHIFDLGYKHESKKEN